MLDNTHASRGSRLVPCTAIGALSPLSINCSHFSREEHSFQIWLRSSYVDQPSTHRGKEDKCGSSKASKETTQAVSLSGKWNKWYAHSWYLWRHIFRTLPNATPCVNEVAVLQSKFCAKLEQFLRSPCTIWSIPASTPLFVCFSKFKFRA